jgi:hypothetical protein
MLVVAYAYSKDKMASEQLRISYTIPTVSKLTSLKPSLLATAMNVRQRYEPHKRARMYDAELMPSLSSCFMNQVAFGAKDFMP